MAAIVAAVLHAREHAEIGVGLAVENGGEGRLRARRLGAGGTRQERRAEQRRCVPNKTFLKMTSPSIARDAPMPCSAGPATRPL